MRYNDIYNRADKSVPCKSQKLIGSETHYSYFQLHNVNDQIYQIACHKTSGPFFSKNQEIFYQLRKCPSSILMALGSFVHFD